MAKIILQVPTQRHLRGPNCRRQLVVLFFLANY